MINKKVLKILYVVLLTGLTCGCLDRMDGVRMLDQIPYQSPTPDILDPFKANLILDYQTDLHAMQNASIYTIDIHVDDDLSSFAGEMDVRYTNQENEHLDQIYFKLVPNSSGENLDVNEVIVEDKPVYFSLENENTILRVDLPATLGPKEMIVITISFKVRVPLEMGGNYGLFIFQDDILALDSFFPIIPVFQNDSWQVEDPPTNADMVFTDVAFFMVTVNSPEDLVWVASGVLDQVVNEGGRQTVTFLAGPQRDFYLAASKNFRTRSLMVGETLVTSYFLENGLDAGLLVLNSAAKALYVFNQRFGKYPYTELDLVGTPMNAGGMEYSGAVALSLDLYNGNITPGGIPARDYLESATAHEVAHQWFFNQVMNDQIDEPWLDEGLAQYATYLYYLDTYGDSAARAYRQSWDQRWSRIEMELIPIGRPADAYTQREYSAIIYGRAPILIEEIADIMGENSFNAFIKEYVKSNRWGIVDGQLLFKTAEESCSCDLESLYREWVLE